MTLLSKAVSLANRMGCKIKALFYHRDWLRRQEAPLPVISVGNIIFGGSGKTPMVMHLLEFLKEIGWNPAVVTRGYKGQWERKGGVLSDGQAILGDWKTAGDEPYMVAKRFPSVGVFVGKNRMASCFTALKYGFDIVVLDDGFQHLRLKRDLDIVLHDPGEKAVFRESPSALKRADILFVNRLSAFQTRENLQHCFPRAKIFGYSVVSRGIYSGRDGRSIEKNILHGRRWIAVSGIARPDRFSSLLKDMGLYPLSFFKCPDHHAYPLSTLNKIKARLAAQHADAVLTTEKDIAKLSGRDALGDISLYYLKIGLDIDREFYEEAKRYLKNAGG